MHQESANGGVDLGRLRAWRSFLRSEKPAIVHVRGLGNEGFHGALAARLAGVPGVLVSVHGTHRDLSGPMTPKRWLMTKVLEPATLRMATHVTTVCSSAAEREFLDPVRSKLVEPMVNGVDVAPRERGTRSRLRTELGIAPDALVLISVGRMTWEKGHGDLADALEVIPAASRTQVELVLIGDGPQATEIVEKYRTAGVAVHALGRRQDVHDLLSVGDLFVFPSWHENLSNALIEAMASGLPVIATSVGGNVEVLESGGGVLVTAHDSGALAGGLQRLLEDPGLREKLGAEAQEVARSRYSVDAMVASVERIYRRMLAEAGQ